MTGKILMLPAPQRQTARAQCDAVSMIEASAQNYVRWWAVWMRDWLRWCWGV